jgi:prepilin-type N-terminal cleavage/methylation domain-containing protein
VTRVLRRIGHSLRRTQGFSLVELLVVIAAGTVVMSCLFTIIDVTLHQTTNTYDRVDATQRARTTLESIANELHAACIGPGDIPIQPQSSATSLLFVSQYSNSASVTPVIEHEVYLDASNNLWERTYASVGSISPPWTFATTPSTTRLLLANVRSVQFQYFAYQQVAYNDAAGNPYVMLLDGANAVPGTTTIPSAAPLPTPLSGSDSNRTVEVTINVVAGPGGGTGQNTKVAATDATAFDSLILRLSPAANHAGNGATFNPCE